MRHFLAIRPPDALLELVMQFRRAHGWQSAEPHITVKAPCGLGEPTTWLPAVRQLCQHVEAFPIEIGGIGTFGGTVLFLQAASPALLALHHQLLQVLNTTSIDQKACFEGPYYTPHLTLTDQQSAGNALNNKSLSAANDYFSKKMAFQAGELAVYSKTELGIYQLMEALPFGNNVSIASA